MILNTSKCGSLNFAANPIKKGKRNRDCSTKQIKLIISNAVNLRILVARKYETAIIAPYGVTNANRLEMRFYICKLKTDFNYHNE
jgi:hypothetical protein